jgi:hypothetical protein
MDLYFLTRFRMKNTRMPMTAANITNESNVSAIIKIVISRNRMDLSGIPDRCKEYAENK